MSLRHLINIVESMHDAPVSVIDQMEKAARECGVHLEVCDTCEGDSVYDDVRGELADVDSAIVINYIRADNPQGGDGSRAMKAVCEIADRAGVELFLQPEGRTPTPILQRWYASFGFRILDRNYMVRDPH